MSNPPQQPWSWHPAPDQPPAEAQPQQHRHQPPQPPDQAPPVPRRQAPPIPDRVPVAAQGRRVADHGPMPASMVDDRASDQDQVPPYGDDGPYADNAQTPDPAPWLPTKALVIIAGIAVIALIVTIVVCLLLWITPPLQPMDVPSVPAA